MTKTVFEFIRDIIYREGYWNHMREKISWCIFHFIALWNWISWYSFILFPHQDFFPSSWGISPVTSASTTQKPVEKLFSPWMLPFSSICLSFIFNDLIRECFLLLSKENFKTIVLPIDYKYDPSYHEALYVTKCASYNEI